MGTLVPGPSLSLCPPCIPQLPSILQNWWHPPTSAGPTPGPPVLTSWPTPALRNVWQPNGPHPLLPTRPWWLGVGACGSAPRRPLGPGRQWDPATEVGPPTFIFPSVLWWVDPALWGMGGMHAMELDGCPGRDSLAPGTDTPQWPWLTHTIGHLQRCGGPEPQERGAWLDHRPLQARCLLEQGVVPGSQKSRNWGFPEP